MVKKLPELKIIPTKPVLFESSGVQKKPEECKFCPNNKSVGFVPDWLPENPKILLVFASPEKDDPVEFKPWAGAMGYYRENTLLKPLGLSRYDVAITHILRCYSGRDKFGKLAYPAKSIRVKAETTCRNYDLSTWKSGQRTNKGIVSFNPDTFVITFDIGDLRYGSAYTHLFQRDIKKALDIANRGGRPAVLFGNIPVSLFAPYAVSVGSGGIKSWRGHIFNSSWKELNIKSENYSIESDDFTEYDESINTQRNSPKKSKPIFFTPAESTFKGKDFKKRR